MKIGLIGIGELGIAIAKNMIKAGHDLHVYDARPEAMATAERYGATPAASSLALAADSDVRIDLFRNILARPQGRRPIGICRHIQIVETNRASEL